VGERLHCRHGHAWKPDFDPSRRPIDLTGACPVCGDLPIGPLDVTDATPCGSSLVAVENWINRRRTATMAAVGNAWGLSFTAHATQEHLRAIAPFALFNQGHDQKAYNVIHGPVGDAEVVLMDYQFTTGEGRSACTNQRTAVILPHAATALPDFQIAPRTLLDKVLGFFTPRGLELQDADAFNRRCLLTGPREGPIRRAFPPGVSAFFGRQGKLSVESLDGHLLIYWNRQVRPEQCRALAVKSLEIRAVLQGATGKRCQEPFSRAVAGVSPPETSEKGS
jgi:hypothetical protein